MENHSETLVLNGSDWEAEYFISPQQFEFWRSRSRNLENMLMDSAISSGFVRGEDAPGAMTGTVPGCDRSFLLENGLIADPYFGRNLEQTVWAEKASWAFRKWFVVPESWRGRRVRIDFGGIDYSAFFVLNGVGLGEHTGAFMPCGFDITEWVKFGERNILAVGFYPAPQGTPNHQEQEPSNFSRFHRTQIGFGWDWGRKFVPTGIWGDVTVTSYEKARLCDWNATEVAGGIDVTLQLENRFDGAQVPLAVTLTPPDGAGEAMREERCLTLLGGASSHVVRFDVPEVCHWMPNGYGRQSLYDIEVLLDGDEALHRKVGFKELVMKRNPDAPEGASPLLFQINGRRVFVNGVNWVPPNLMAACVQPRDVEHLVALAANAGVNLFRMWGGGELEKEAFYDACDAYGIMVWHEFFHACSNSPKNDSAYLAVKEREARAVLKTLRHHVSLSLVCGGNETQYYGEIPDAPLLGMYERVVRELTPSLPFHVSSPDLSRPGERPHGPWDFREHAFYNAHNRQLASEYGCNAMPVYESLRKFIPEKECRLLKGQALQYHFYNTAALRPGYAFDKALSRFAVRDSAEYCDATMVAQGDVARYMTEHYRRRFPLSSGSVFWQYNEPWPTCAWSIVDFYGVPKQAMYELKQASAPVLLSLEDDSWCLLDGRLRAGWFCTVNEGAATGEAVPCTLKAFSADGEALFTKAAPVTLNAGTWKLLDVDEAVPAGTVVVVRMEITGIACMTRVYGSPDYQTFFVARGDVRLKDEGDGSWTVSNIGRGCALAVRLSALPGAPEMDHAFFSDDYLTLLPGEARTVTLHRSL